MLPLLRLLLIFRVCVRFGLLNLALNSLRPGWLKTILAVILFPISKFQRVKSTRGERLRLALESLGPIFVKFGQVLSTRRDLLPPDLALELAHLQDNVKPFDSAIAIAQITKSLGTAPEELFDEFEATPVASASIAQVHFAKLKGSLDDPKRGREVAIKVLRPGMQKIIQNDMALLGTVAVLIEKLWADGKRLRPREVVAEFKKYLHDELDLMREAANASQLRRNFADSNLLAVPEIFWDYTTTNVLTMERMYGIPIGNIDELKAANVDLQKLSCDGVEIFFTQVFRDGFFHADMHPGNIYVDVTPEHKGRYIALDFGIVGTLNDFDKNYLAQNFLAFFRRDYKRVAEAHIESGWAPKGTRIDELEAAVRACCEPIFDRPLREISLGQVLLRLFQTSRRFNIEVQPQLVLLQKTLLNIEGLGRQLDPDLDLWKTAKPYLERWMRERVGWQGLRDKLRWEASQWSQILPQLPRLLHQALLPKAEENESLLLKSYTKQQRKIKRWLMLIACLLTALLGLMWYIAMHINWLPIKLD